MDYCLNEITQQTMQCDRMQFNTAITNSETLEQSTVVRLLFRVFVLFLRSAVVGETGSM